jgi:Mn2+/Fe2+ NRAMP family transporter
MASAEPSSQTTHGHATVRACLHGLFPTGLSLRGVMRTSACAEIEDLGNKIGENVGEVGKVFFCAGLYAAAYSSAITCPLGAALTAQQILSEVSVRPPHVLNAVFGRKETALARGGEAGWG